MKALARQLIHGGYNALPGQSRSRVARLITAGLSAADIEDALTKIRFFLPSVQEVQQRDTLSPDLLASPAVILHGLGDNVPGWLKAHPGRFEINRNTNPQEGWNWIDAAAYVAQHQPDLPAAVQRFQAALQRMGVTPHQQDRPCYVFGTGPSLGLAAERDWSDGLRIVCNTIVRDPELWAHIQPHLIVAGDGIYHFGFTEFARAFRHDLKARLESSDALFLYPAQFDVIVRRELGHLPQQLVPIAIGQHTAIHHTTLTHFELPALGNVLNLLLLPIGSLMAKRVGLWGFDGRAPADKLFWSNSAKQSYTELLPTLQAAHPAFFDHNVPKHDPEKYLRSVHGDVLENCLRDAEAAGWRYEMLHPTWTPTLAQRRAPGVPATPQ